MVSSAITRGRSCFAPDRSEAALHAELPESGQPLELKALFHAHYAAVWRLLRRFGVRPPHLDDAAQEVFWIVARRLGQIRAGSESAFLYGVALRVASNRLRRDRNLPPLSELEEVAELAAADPSPEERLAERRDRELLDSVLDRMPLELRSVFVLFELEGLEVRQIAELEGIPVGTASSRLRRAREEFSAIAKRVRAALLREGAGR